ncbi:patellin-4-like [Primulina tabacum]|uniref:patellin-4-like n=1 Tax=Primulina tabacum TaxID=48773 RepID=UPI003F594046
MTVEMKAETMQMAEEAVKVAEQVCNEKDRACESKAVEKINSYREESNFMSYLKQHERKALNELKSKLEEAISGSTLFDKEVEKKVGDVPTGEELQKEKPAGENEEGCEEEKKNGYEGTEEKPSECAKTPESDANNEEIYQKTLATEEKREQFLRWRVQLMEKGTQKLNFKPGGVSSFVQINDLKNSPGPSKKEVRSVVRKTVALLQDNYPEFVAKNIFVNVPFWYYAFHSLISPFLTQRSKSKLVFARPSKVTETLLKYIPIQEIPIQYGGMKRENKLDDEVSELLIRVGSTTSFEIPIPEAGTGITWDILVLGWEVNCTVEFVPDNENSCTLIIQKERKMCSEEAPFHGTFKNKEPGKIAITIGNTSGKKKKVFYFYSYILKNSNS